MRENLKLLLNLNLHLLVKMLKVLKQDKIAYSEEEL
jgi:hypothetical protein